MKHMKRAFAMLLCVAMVLSMCTMFAGAADIRYYNTLDEIPEDVSVFRVICTGSISVKYAQNGNCYYQFYKKDHPIVWIKATAFMNAPTNGYLKADNIALSRDCKNPATKDLEYGGTTRVCYYKKWAITDTYTRNNILEAGRNYQTPMTGEFAVYTFSMYRFKLKANAYYYDKELRVEAKFTDGVTFDYDSGKEPSLALNRRPQMIAPRPVISAKIASSSQDVWFYGCEVKEGVGSYSEVGATELAALGAEAVGCVAGVAANVTLGLIGCVPLVLSVAQTISNRHYSSNGQRSDYRESITSPIKLTVPDDYIVVSYYINQNGDYYKKSDATFEIVFSF